MCDEEEKPGTRRKLVPGNWSHLTSIDLDRVWQLIRIRCGSEIEK